jgi:hypothetical protein
MIAIVRLCKFPASTQHHNSVSLCILDFNKFVKGFVKNGKVGMCSSQIFKIGVENSILILIWMLNF